MKLAINGGTVVRDSRKEPWPQWPVSTEEDEARLLEVLRSGVWSYNGPKEIEFLQRWAAFSGTEYAVAAVNGTVTLQLALEALDIGWGDEVILPGLTWQATAASVVDVNAVPILVDVDPKTWCLDPSAVEAAISPKTRAIMPVHLYGSMPDMDAILEIAEKNHLAVIEDCAHQHGSSWRGRPVGSLGTIGSFSLQLSKVLTAGEGGLITTNDRELWIRLDALRNCGRRPEGAMPEADKGGGRYGSDGDLIQSGNYRITEFQAAVLLGALERLPEQMERRARSGELLDAGLQTITGVEPMTRDERQTTRAYFNYAFRYNSDEFAGGGIPSHVFHEALSVELGIPFEACYEPLNNCSLYRPQTKKRYHISEAHWAAIDPSRFSLPNCERAFLEESVVVHHKLLLDNDEAMRRTLEAIRKIEANADELRKG